MDIVQLIINRGPNPGNTQLPGGLDTVTDKPLTPGNSFFGIITCATYGGPHQSETLTDSDGNIFVLAKALTGGQGNINTAQQTLLYYCEVLKGNGITPDKLHQQFVGGDNDYQALLGVELTPSKFIGASGYAQNSMPPGKSIINSGAVITVPAGSVGFGFGFNISELGKAGSITPIPTAPAAVVVNSLDFFEPQGNNVCLSRTQIFKDGVFRASFDNASTAPLESFQTLAIVFADAAVAIPTTVFALTSAQSANLAAGGMLVIQGTKA